MSPPTSTGLGCRVSQTSPGNGSHRGPETQQEVSYARSLVCSSIVFFIVIASLARAAGLTQAEAISKARQYLATSNQTTRAQLAAELNTYAGDIDAVIAALKPVAPTAVQYGFSGLQHFTVPELQPKYWADQLYYYVPSSYNPSQPTGLFIGLHGGGARKQQQVIDINKITQSSNNNCYVKYRTGFGWLHNSSGIYRRIRRCRYNRFF